MTQRNVTKALLCAEDILQGVGAVQQMRNKTLLNLHKLDIYVPVTSSSEIANGNLEFYRFYRRKNRYTDYRYNPTGTTGIMAVRGGSYEAVNSDTFVAVTDYGWIGDGKYRPLQELIDNGTYNSLAEIQEVYPKAVSLTQSIDWAALQTCLDDNAGRSIYIPRGYGRITQTIIIPTGTYLIGEGRYDIWTDDKNYGTIIGTYGPGNPQRWTDITGTDEADDTPLFVAGGPGVYLINMALRSDDWSVGMFYPSVRQCGFNRLLIKGFTDACMYLDMTWSTRNAVMNALHPDVHCDGGMNEFSGVDFYFRTDADGAFALKIQGTTRPGTVVATAEEWQWGWGGNSDCRFSHGRLNGGGVNGGCFKQDAQLFGETSYGQGVTLHDVALRLHGSGRYSAYLDRANRTIFDGCYGEHANSPAGWVAYFAVTSRTQKNHDGIIRINDKLSGYVLLDEVVVGSNSTIDWSNTRCITVHRVDGRMATPNMRSLDTTRMLELISFDYSNGVLISLDNGTGRTQYFAASAGNFRPQQDGINLGSGNHYWNTAYMHGWQSDIGVNIDVPDMTFDQNLNIRVPADGEARFREGPVSMAVITKAGIISYGDSYIVAPTSDNVAPLCTASKRATTVYLGSAPIVTSDRTHKSPIEAIPDEVLDVWAVISPKRYKLIDGSSGRWHTGWIAQDILEAFAAAGLDATEYGVVCKDEWEATPARELVTPGSPEVRSSVDGSIIRAAVPETVETIPAVEAGVLWQVRYDEAQAIENAYLRRELARRVS